jgi:hypothetical protein
MVIQIPQFPRSTILNSADQVAAPLNPKRSRRNKFAANGSWWNAFCALARSRLAVCPAAVLIMEQINELEKRPEFTGNAANHLTEFFKKWGGAK